MSNYVRTKTYYCGEQYREIDVFTMAETEINNRCRKYKQNMTAPKQKRLNTKMAQRYFALLIKTNFGARDYHLTLTYDDAYLPESIEAAEREVKNYVRRLARKRKAKGLDALKYIIVTEKSEKGRIHHHLIINGGISRDEVEDLWRRPRRKGQKQGDALGYANARRLQITDQGLDALAGYLSKDPKGRKRWIPSQNLEKPQVSVSDTKTSKRKFYQMTLWPEDCEKIKEHFETQNPGFEMTECQKKYNAETSTWYFTVKMRRRI